MDKRYQIFVSSTYIDLLEERAIVMQTLMRMNCIPAGMELFPAADEEQFEFIKRVIDGCDYYLLIIGGRYGSLTSEGLSYTEKEYDYAVGKKIKVIALIHGEPNKIPSGKSETSAKLRKKLEAFRNKVAKNRLVNFWTEASQLSGFVALNVADAINMYPAVGWVRANQVSNAELLGELNELRKNKERLEAEIETLKSDSDISIFKPQEESEFYYIYSKIKGYYNIKLLSTLKTADGGKSPKTISKKCNVRFSLLRVLYQKAQTGAIRFTEHFLSPLQEEIKTNKSFTALLEQGHIFRFYLSSNTNEYLQLRGTLITSGFLHIENRIQNSSLSGIRTEDIFTYTEKFYRFVNWLDYNNKLEAEPFLEFVEFIESPK